MVDHFEAEPAQDAVIGLGYENDPFVGAQIPLEPGRNDSRFARVS